MRSKKTTLSLAVGALAIFQVLTVRAEAPASQLVQAQAIMGAPASPETKLDALFNGGSAKRSGIVAPALPDGNAARHLDLGTAQAAGSGLDQALIPSPTASARNQARFGYYDKDVPYPCPDGSSLGPNGVCYEDKDVPFFVYPLTAIVIAMFIIAANPANR